MRSAVRRASARRLLCVATIAACTPYLVLKTLWVAGVAVGVYEADFLDRAAGTTFLTSLLDLCVVGLAILFVHPAGRRLPAWLLAGPTWVATGLLAPLIGGVLIGTSTQLLLGGANLLGDSAGLERWVFAVVYGGFLLQAVLLLTAFVLYARDRWPAVFDDPRSVSPATGEATRTPVTEQVLSWAFVIGSAALAALCTCNAVVGNGLHPDPAPFQRIGDIVFAVLAAAGATAFLRMQNGGPMRHGLLIAGWIGSSATFAESLILITGLLLAGEGDSRAYGPAGSLVVLLALLCGLAGAAVGMIRLESQVSRAAVTDEESELATP